MITSYERFIAGRYLMPGKSERFIFLVATISLIAVALGVAALIAVMSVMNGFRAELFDRIQGLNGHAVVQGYGGRLSGWEEVAAKVAASPGVVSVTPLIEQPLMASAISRVEAALVRGMRLEDIRRTAVIADNLLAGSLDNLADTEPVVAVAARLAENLGIRVGDSIALIAPQGEVTPFGTVPRIVSYTVGAIFEIGIFDYDRAFVVLPLPQAQLLLGMEGEVGMLEVTTESADRVGPIMAPLVPALESQAVILDWRQMNAALFEALVVDRLVTFWVLSIIILVATFNILSSLIMLVRSKTRDIAILRTMGASRAAMMRIFVMLGTAIGASGVALGVALGFLLLAWRQGIVVGVSRLTGADIWDPSIRYLTELPAKTDPLEVVGIVALTLILSFLATLYPAWKAASTDPVTVLRYE
jgi:lipoprotein-releasing system permease protein